MTGVQTCALPIFFEADKLETYRKYQRDHEDEPLLPGIGLPLVRALLRINDKADTQLVEVVLVSRNDADSGLRILNSIESLGLDITRCIFTGGQSASPYARALDCDLFLSHEIGDVSLALQSGIAAASVFAAPPATDDDADEVRLAFDGDAVLFGPASQRVYDQGDLDEFQRHEKERGDVPLEPGPFKGFVAAIQTIQRRFREIGQPSPIRTALVTARNAPAHKRVIKTLREWDMNLDEAYFLGGIEKKRLLEVFRPHIFFDDQKSHLEPAKDVAPAALVPMPEDQPAADGGPVVEGSQ